MSEACPWPLASISGSVEPCTGISCENSVLDPDVWLRCKQALSVASCVSLVASLLCCMIEKEKARRTSSRFIECRALNLALGCLALALVPFIPAVAGYERTLCENEYTRNRNYGMCRLQGGLSYLARMWTVLWWFWVLFGGYVTLVNPGSRLQTINRSHRSVFVFSYLLPLIFYAALSIVGGDDGQIVRFNCFAPGDFDSEFLDFLTTYSVFIIVSLLGFNMIVKMSLFVRAAIISLSKSTSASDRTGGKSLVPHLARIFMHLLLVVIPMIFNQYFRYLAPKFNSPLYDLWIDCVRSQFQAGLDPLPLCRSIASAVDLHPALWSLFVTSLFWASQGFFLFVVRYTTASDLHLLYSLCKAAPRYFRCNIRDFHVKPENDLSVPLLNNRSTQDERYAATQPLVRSLLRQGSFEATGSSSPSSAGELVSVPFD